MPSIAHTAASDRYERMPYARCGASGMLLPRLSLGLWQDFGPDADSRARVLRAFDRGVTYFDLADNYGATPGVAEESFGALLHADLAPYRDELIVASKAGYLMWPGPYGNWGSRKHLLAGLDQSLRRLKLDYVDIFYTHRPDPETPPEETAEALAQAVRAGKALYIGLSNYNAAQTAHMSALLKARGIAPLIHQGRLNLLDAVSAPVLPVARAQGMGFVAFSPLAQGLLCERQLAHLPADSRAARAADPRLREKRAQSLPLLRELAALAKELGRTLEQLALAWLWAHGDVTTIAGSARTLPQLDSLIDAALMPALTPAEFRRVENVRLGGGPQPDRTLVG